MKIQSIILIASMICMGMATGRSQAPEEPLKLVGTIPLTGLHDGDFDHFQVDFPSRRLFLAAEGNQAVVVIDLRTNKVIHTITDLVAPHSIAYNPEAKKLFVADEERVEIYDGTSYKLLGQIPMKAHADVSLYDPKTQLLYVGNGGRVAHEKYCLISIIDTNRGEKIGDIRLDVDHIESMALEKSGQRLFVSLTADDSVGVIDREKQTLIAKWSYAEEGHANGPLVFDEADHRIFLVSRTPNRLIVLDSDTGKIVAGVPSVGQFVSDDAAYDPVLKRIYLTGTPFINVFQQRTPNNYQILGQVPSSFHTATGILIPQLNQYYIAVNHHGSTSAVVKVYKVVP